MFEHPRVELGINESPTPSPHPLYLHILPIHPVHILPTHPDHILPTLPTHPVHILPMPDLILFTGFTPLVLWFSLDALWIDWSVPLRSYNAQNGLDVLKVHRISKAQAWQRLGRAGRISAGSCYRLYTEKEFELFEENTTPEILRYCPAIPGRGAQCQNGWHCAEWNCSPMIDNP